MELEADKLDQKGNNCYCAVFGFADLDTGADLASEVLEHPAVALVVAPEGVASVLLAPFAAFAILILP